MTVNGGTLDYSGGVLPGLASGVYCPYTISGGTLNIGSMSTFIGTFQLAGGTVTGTGTLTSNAAYDIESVAHSAVLAGSVGLNKTTTGVATIMPLPRIRERRAFRRAR